MIWFYFLLINLYFDYAPVLVKTFKQISLCVVFVCMFIYSMSVLIIHHIPYKIKSKSDWVSCVPE